MARLLNTADELKASFAQLDVNAEWSGFQSFIEDAEDLLAEIIGYHIINKLAENRSSEDPVVQRAIRYLSRANAYLGVYIWSKTAMYTFSDKALYIVKLEKGAIISDKKLQDLHAYCQETGFKFLDLAITLMEANLDKFPDFADAPERQRSRQYFLQNAGEFSAFHTIRDSLVTFQALLPIMADVEQRFLPGYMGEEFYLEYKQQFLAEALDEEQKKLLPYIKKAIALLTVSESFYRLPVQLKNGGLFVDSFTSTTEYEQKLVPAQEEREKLKSYYFCQGENVLIKLRQYLTKNAAKYEGFMPTEAPITTINSLNSGIFAS